MYQNNEFGLLHNEVATRGLDFQKCAELPDSYRNLEYVAFRPQICNVFALF